jgi:membrane protein DedA with SNARE-associated domain/rhodanese-related sulfurtransferase
MPDLIHLLQTYGVLIVFTLVLVEQMGLPIPAYPILIVAGALAAAGDLAWPLVVTAALCACLLSDLFWFRAGRMYGKRILRLLCKISLNPDYCVSQTEDNFSRFGPKSLVVSKFIPGFNTIAAPLSGAMGTPPSHFFGFAMAGGLLWVGSGVAIGAYFHQSVGQVLDVLSTMGSTALGVLLALLTLFVLAKYVERRRFQKGMQVERISMGELVDLIDGGHEPLIVDARSATAQQLEAPIPGAVLFNAQDPDAWLASLDPERHIVVYCSCPNDVTAAQVAKQLMARGFRRARPLHGGLDAWNAHRGEAVEA